MVSRAAGAVRWGVVVAAIAVLLGHICAGPLEAETVRLLDHHASGAEHEHGGDGEAVHAGSCEMTRPLAASSFSGVPSSSTLPRYEVPVQRLERARAFPVAPHATSPPLFLVHAALLI
jgi:hypothetical protein